MNIELLQIEELKPYANNARHNEKAIDVVAASIKEFGFKNPILIDSDNEIIAGHTRLLAAQKLGLKEVPTIKIDDLTPEQVKAFRIADNKTAEYAEWNFELLAQELEDLKLVDYDLSLTGFDLSEAEKLLDTLKDGIDGENPDDNFDIELPEVPISRLGDLWLLGKHRLVCGDSTSQDDVAVLLGEERADMVFTDPPWNVNYGSTDHPSWKSRTIMNDAMPTEEFKEFMNSTFRVMRKFSKEGCMTYVVMSQQEWGNLMLTMKDNEYHWSSTIIWKKDSLVLSRKDFNTIYEGIWYGWLEGAARLHPVTNMKECDCWEIPRYKVSIYHPTQKPVDLVIRAIKNSSDMKDVVLDLFGGSGTTLIACEESDRICRMMELDPKYADVIVKRYLDKIGSEDAVYLVRDGQQYKYSELQLTEVAIA